MSIKQGHAYRYGAIKVIALESSDWWRVRVAEVLDSGWPGVPFYTYSSDLTPLPMAYFHGQTPQ